MKNRGECRVRVIYADTDAMGIVYYANYLKWFEIGRNELMRDMGIAYDDLEKSGYSLPVIELGCEYLYPARYDELLVIETVMTTLRRASIRFDYVIYSDKKERILAEGFTRHPFLNSKGKIVRVPQHIADIITNEEEYQRRP